MGLVGSIKKGVKRAAKAAAPGMSIRSAVKGGPKKALNSVAKVTPGGRALLGGKGKGRGVRASKVTPVGSPTARGGASIGPGSSTKMSKY